MSERRRGTEVLSRDLSLFLLGSPTGVPGGCGRRSRDSSLDLARSIDRVLSSDFWLAYTLDDFRCAKPLAVGGGSAVVGVEGVVVRALVGVGAWVAGAGEEVEVVESAGAVVVVEGALAIPPCWA